MCLDQQRHRGEEGRLNLAETMQKKVSYYPEKHDPQDWLPTSLDEVRRRGWEQLDIILFSGDAYVDHPAFGVAVIGRILEREGYKVAVVPQPNWRDDLRDFRKLGTPRLFFGVTAGNMDSMVNHYTANRRLRSNDAYSIGDQAGFRPDRALTVYSSILRKIFPDTLIIAGGIEASLRRLVHYDYWEDTLRPSVLDRSGIDLLVYGDGERAIVDLAHKIDRGASRQEVQGTLQIAYSLGLTDPLPDWPGRRTIALSSFAESRESKKHFASDFRIIEEESNTLTAARLTQEHDGHRVVINPSFPPAETQELDAIYDLPFTRLPHPRYWQKSVIPAFEMIRFSINIHRGCFGGCAFCTISAHQGKHISSRSADSVLREVERVTQMPGFKGYLSDLGGPSANMYRMEPVNKALCQRCKKPSCIHPMICKNLNVSHKHLLELYHRIRAVKGIKKAFIGSGVRYDLFLNEREQTDPSLRAYPEELLRHHVSGRLKVAPEHTRENVLKIMRKPPFETFQRLKALFDRMNQQEHLKQEIIPYFISSHPGCTLEDMAELAAEMRPLHLHTEQIQDFTPTPMTLASTMFYTGLDPYTLEPVFVETKPEAKLLQRSFFFSKHPEERQKIIRALNKINRRDLIRRIFTVAQRTQGRGSSPYPPKR
jgi:uncharacterized radical SAM protein YgiQ